MSVETRKTMEQEFVKLFGSADDTRLFFAPGRVNLIGEHTDYNGGFVFPAALTYGTYALVQPRKDGIYRFASLNFPGQVVEVKADQIVYREEDQWANYPKGVLQQLVSNAGTTAPFVGANVLYFGDIPNGAGLSSSASIEVVTGYALSVLAGLTIPGVELARLSQKAENEFVGVNCGIMDQFAVSMGKRNHAIKLNCADLSYEYAPLQLDKYRLVITNTNKRRGLADSKYNERRAECETGLSMLRGVRPELRDLGALDLQQWENLRHVVTDSIVRMRVEHVVTENDRVLKAVERLAENDLMTFGKLMNESHDSLRHLYEVTGKELDALAEAAQNVSGCIGSRMTGAGFGGCTVSLVHEDAIDQFRTEVGRKYTEATGLTPTFYICSVGDGVREIRES